MTLLTGIKVTIRQVHRGAICIPRMDYYMNETYPRQMAATISVSSLIMNADKGQANRLPTFKA